MKPVTILRGEPTIAVVAEMRLQDAGITEMVEWVSTHRPECLPDDLHRGNAALWPHEMLRDPLLPVYRENNHISSNELLVELAGRKCYDSFGAKAGRKSNADYIQNILSGDIPHASVLYHAKMSFFFAGVSRRVSHEIIRNYVGADRDEEGSPSQESTRFTHHHGWFVCPPRYLGDKRREDFFEASMQLAYDNYLIAVQNDTDQYERDHNGEPPKSMERKRIYEAASAFLPHMAETSFIWTTNPMAIAKFVRERADSAADLEIQRFAKKWRRVVVARWPNLFPQPWMREST